MSNFSDSTLPSLEDKRFLRFAAFALLYAAQGLPWGLFVIGIPSWAAGKDYSAAEIGTFIAIASMPWSFKLVAGPLMDRYTFLAMGRRRPWVIGAQAGILLGLFVLAAVPDPVDNLMLVAWVGFLINSFCALQDVAVDGMAIDILPVDERARANAFMFGGQLVGISAAASGGTYALSHFGLDAAAIIIASSVFIIMQVPVFFRERHGERLMPWTPGAASKLALSNQTKAIGRVFVDVSRALILPMSFVLVICEFLNRASTGLATAISPVLAVQQLGWLDTEFANLQAGLGVMAAIFGVLVSPWIDRRGAGITLTFAMSLKFAAYLAVGSLVSLWQYDEFITTVLVVLNLTQQVITVAIIALFMNICWMKVSATQFAVYMASSNLAFAAGSALVAPLGMWLDFQGMFFFCAALCGLFLLVWPVFNLERHSERIKVLEVG